MSSEGWRCPTCGSVYAPWVPKCRLCPGTDVTTTGSTMVRGDVVKQRTRLTQEAADTEDERP